MIALYASRRRGKIKNIYQGKTSPKANPDSLKVKPTHSIALGQKTSHHGANRQELRDAVSTDGDTQAPSRKTRGPTKLFVPPNSRKAKGETRHGVTESRKKKTHRSTCDARNATLLTPVLLGHSLPSGLSARCPSR